MCIVATAIVTLLGLCVVYVLCMTVWVIWFTKEFDSMEEEDGY